MKFVAAARAARIRPKTLSNSTVASIARSYDHNRLKTDLRHITVQRVPDTPGHNVVRSYISDSLRRASWHVTEDRFQATTPHGLKNFTNIIANYNIKDNFRDKRIVLAAHYDSKYFPEPNAFVAATDSAVPCGLLLDIANFLPPLLPENSPSPGIQLIFFDGEEAFVDWTAEDSLYGSRHLAEKWSKEIIDEGERTMLSGIEALILLDLLGVENTPLYSLFSDTHHMYSRFVAIERRLKAEKLIEGVKGEIFREQLAKAGVEDDHVPFLRRKVPIVHLIPLPFPHVWHTPNDNLDAVHYPTIAALAKIFRVFVAEYLRIEQ